MQKTTPVPLSWPAATIAIANGLPQIFAYDAYGNALGFDPAAALTTLLYSGEQFDARIAMLYLRARPYDAFSGRFPSLDTFMGKLQDPQSFHKYLYTHADPINGIDPTGEVALIAELLIAVIIVGLLTVAFWNDRHDRLWFYPFDPIGNPLQKSKGQWSGPTYLSHVLPSATGEEFYCVKKGCVGLLGLRLGFVDADTRPWNRIDKTKGFDTRDAAEAYYDVLGPSAHLYMLQVSAARPPAQPPIAGGLPHEIDPKTLGNFEAGPPLEEGTANFNFASRLKLRDGTKTWEWMPEAEYADPRKLRVYRGDPRQATRTDYYFVSPSRNEHFVDESR